MNLKEWLNYLIDLLLRKPNIKNGFINYIPKDKDVIFSEEKERVLGNSRPVIKENSQWEDFTPTGEAQKRNGHETMSCTSQSSANAIETLLNFYNFLVNNDDADEETQEIVKIFKYFGLFKNGECNVSDRYIAKLSGTSRRGNTFKNVWDAIRHYGLVPEDRWPWVDGWRNYYSPVPFGTREQGKKLLEFVEFNYEFISPLKQIKSLKRGVPTTAVYAWNGQNEDGSYYPVAYPLNHATCRVGFIDNKNHKIFDSYPDFHKLTTWDFRFGWGVLFSIHLKKKLNIYDIYNKEEIKKLLAEGKQWFIRANDKGQAYEITENGLKYIPDIKDLSDKIAEKMKESPENVNDMLEFLTKSGKIKWATEKEYFDLIK